MRTLVIVAVVAVLLLGCQQSPPANPLASPMGPDARALKEEGDRLVRSRDWAGAAAKYQMALNRESSNLDLRLVYGITLSHLDRRDETAEQFRWVINHSQPGQLVMPRTPPVGNDTMPKGGVRGMTSWP